MALDHEAIYSAYSGTVVTIDDSKGAFDADGKMVTLDSAKVTAARKAIDDAYAAVEYQRKRKEVQEYSRCFAYIHDSVVIFHFQIT